MRGTAIVNYNTNGKEEEMFRESVIDDVKDVKGRLKCGAVTHLSVFEVCVSCLANRQQRKPELEVRDRVALAVEHGVVSLPSLRRHRPFVTNQRLFARPRKRGEGRGYEEREIERKYVEIVGSKTRLFSSHIYAIKNRPPPFL